MNIEFGKLQISEAARLIATELECPLEMVWLPDQRQHRGSAETPANGNGSNGGSAAKKDDPGGIWVLECSRPDSGMKARVEFSADQIENSFNNGVIIQTQDRLRATILKLLPSRGRHRPHFPMPAALRRLEIKSEDPQIPPQKRVVAAAADPTVLLDETGSHKPSRR